MEELAYKIKADFFKALAHPIRLQIIEFLKNGEKNAGSIVKHLNIPQSSLSRHLLDLKEAGVLKSRQQGTAIYYGIEDHEIFQVLRLIAEMLRKKLKKNGYGVKRFGQRKIILKKKGSYNKKIAEQ